MSVIYKQLLMFGDSNSVVASADVKFIHAGLDPQGEPCVWYETDPAANQYHHQVRILGTGREVPSGHAHIGSYVEGSYVWHVYVQRS